MQKPDQLAGAALTDPISELPCADQGARADCPARSHIAELQAEVLRLNQLVHTDNLTGLYNQRHLMAALENEMERTRRTGRSTAIIVLDLDHFKRVNDTWGHEAGNQVLRVTAQCLLSAIRRIDVACRFGGEEFVVILPNSDLTESIKVAERIRATIETSVISTDAGVIPVTASLGVDVYRADQNEAPEAFISRADGFLYAAKSSGRNQVGHPPKPKAAVVSHDERDALFSLFSGGDDD